MPINFPDSPTVDESFTFGDRTWIWDGSAWNSADSSYTAGTGLILTGAEFAVNAQVVINPMTAAGDLILGGVSGSAGRLGLGLDGKILTSNGTTATWGDAPSGLPAQTDNAGRYLTTNGTAASWEEVSTDPNPQIFMMMGA